MLKTIFPDIKNPNKLALLIFKNASGLGSLYSTKILSIFGASKSVKYVQFLELFGSESTNSAEILYTFLKQKKMIKESVSKLGTNRSQQAGLRIRKFLRSSLGLPIRGQRTHTNAKTTRKNKKW